MVVGSLFCCFPLGLYLLWAKSDWTPRTKGIITGAWALLFVFGAVQKPSGPAVPRPRARADAEPRRVAAAPASAPAAPLPDGSAFAVAEPKLLLPVTVDGFQITGAEDRPDGGSVAADYESTKGDGLKLQALVLVGSEPLPKVSRGIEGATVGAHEAVIIEDRKARRVSVLWPSGAWEFTLDVLYAKPAARAAARKAAIAVAPSFASEADRYLNGAPRPPMADRDAHVAAIDKAVSNHAAEQAAASKRAADAQAAKLLQQRVNAYAKALSRAGIDRRAILRVDVSEMDENEMVVTVNPAFLAMNRALQLESAKNLWLLWARMNTPTNLDASRIKLVTPMGTEVAASGMLGGSMIHLEDE